MKIVTGREAALGISLFGILVILAWTVPLLTIPATGAILLIALLVSERRRLDALGTRISLLELAIRDADAGIIALEHGQEQVRLLGAPVTVKWNRGTIAPDVANYLIQQVLLRRPGRILECGAGVSTRVLARALRLVGHGQLITLEHDPYWASEIRRTLEAEGLSNHAKVIEAPLVQQTALGREIVWYDMAKSVADGGSFDFAFVDGPPAARPEHPGREGALYALYPLMTPGAVLLMDDGFRPGERAAVASWAGHFGAAIRSELIDLRNGLWKIDLVSATDPVTERTASPITPAPRQS